jgi:YidC/Oxa1 family membrane protein insertase
MKFKIMEQKKLDLNSIIGFILIVGILIWIMYQNQPDEKQIAAEKAKKELVQKQQAETQKVKTAIAAVTKDTTANDSTAIVCFKSYFGQLRLFGYTSVC